MATLLAGPPSHATLSAGGRAPSLPAPCCGPASQGRLAQKDSSAAQRLEVAVRGSRLCLRGRPQWAEEIVILNSFQEVVFKSQWPYRLPVSLEVGRLPYGRYRCRVVTPGRTYYREFHLP